MKDDFQKAIEKGDFQRTMALINKGIYYNHNRFKDGIIVVLNGFVEGNLSEGTVLQFLDQLRSKKIPYRGVSDLESYAEIKENLSVKIQNAIKW